MSNKKYACPSFPHFLHGADYNPEQWLPDKSVWDKDMELMGLAKINNIYALKEAKEISAQWQNSKVFAVLGLLREYDAKSKGVNAGGATEGELLRELLLKIFMQ